MMHLNDMPHIGEGEYHEMMADPPPPEDWNLVPVGYWRTREGVEIAIVDMSDAHLTNAILYFTQRGCGQDSKIRELRAERRRREARR